MPCNKIDALLIINEPRKQKLASYATDKDNVSADKDKTVKRMKRTVDTCEYHEKLSIFLLVTNPPLDVSTSQKSPTIEEIEDEDMRPKGNIPPRTRVMSWNHQMMKIVHLNVVHTGKFLVHWQAVLQP